MQDLSKFLNIWFLSITEILYAFMKEIKYKKLFAV